VDGESVVNARHERGDNNNVSKPAATSVPSNGSPEESTALLSDTLSTGNPDESGVESKRNLKQEYYRAMLSEPNQYLKIRGQAQS
jgi:hypothetical protein